MIKCVPCIVLTLQLIMTTAVSTAQLPATKLYKMDMKANEYKVLLSDLAYLTVFNPDGYNNQPYFIDDDHLLMSSDWESAEQTDIVHLDLASKEVIRITETRDGEYSPTIQPDGIQFSVIRQEAESSSNPSQVLWSYPLDRSSIGSALIVDPDNIGYHCWINTHQVALYLVGDPNELILYDLNTQDRYHIAYKVGRALKTDRRGELYYTQQVGSSVQLRKLDPTTMRSKIVTTPLEGNQDFDILPNGFLITSSGARLYIYRPLIDQEWQELIDLGSSGIRKITRIASSKNRIAFVGSE